MKKRSLKNKIISCVLALCMAVGIMPMWGTTAHAADTDKAMMMGMSGIQSWDQAANDLANTDKVVMGNYNSTDLAYWVVLDDSYVGSGSNYISSGAGKFMFSTRAFGTSAFQSSKSGTYPNSNLHSAMNNFYGSDDTTGTGNFGLTATEKTAIFQTTLAGSSMHTGLTDLTGQRFFPLEVRSPDISEYNYLGSLTKLATGDPAQSWWSRTNHENDTQAFVVANNSSRAVEVDISRSHGIRPAFNLDASKVLFTSAAVDGKTPYNDVDDTLVKISDTAPTVWKMTLLDTGRNSFVLDSGDAIINGNDVGFYYSGATEAANEYISVMIVDRAGAITHYAKVSSALSGSKNLTSFTIPGDMAGNINLKIFNEQANGNNITDYSSPLRDMTVTIPAAVTYNLTNIRSSNTAATYTATSDYSTTLSPSNSNYALPPSITVTVGGAPLTLDTDGTLISGEYSYNSTSGAVAIHKDGVTGAIVITAGALTANNLQSVTQADVTYGTAVSPTLAYSGGATATNGGAVQIMYEGRNTTAYAESVTAPTYVGDYTVRAKSAATATVAQGTQTDDFSITAIAQTPTISTTGSVVFGENIDLSTLVTGQQGTVSFALSTGGGSLNGTIYTAPNTAGTATFDITIAAHDVNNDGTPEYSVYNGTLNINVAELAITNGTGQTVTQGQIISFTSNGDFGGYVDTEVIPSGKAPQVVHTKGNDNANASAVEGSIIVTLSGAYTATLPAGTHTVSINSAGGSASTTFTVVAAAPTPTPTPTPSNTAISPLTGVDSPQTGDNSNTPLVIALMLISALGLTALLLLRKKWMPARKK